MGEVEVVRGADLARLKEEALADPARFAVWPLGYDVPPHHAEWYRLSQLYKADPRFKKIIVLAPTGWGKTTAWGVALPIYEIVQNRSLPIGLVGSSVYNVRPRLAAVSRHLTDNEDLIRGFGYVDPNDQEPRFRPKKPTKWSIDELVVAGSVLRGTDPNFAVFGWESKMEGRHWGLFLGDDVSDYIEAQSPVYRAQQVAWFENVLKQRMISGAREFWVGTRSNAGDLLGYLIDSGEYMVIDEPEALVVDPETGEEVSSWPEYWPTEQLLKERARDPVSFALKRCNKIVGTGITEFPKSAIDACKDQRLVYYGNRQNLPPWLKEKDLWFYTGVDLGGVVATKESKYFVVYTVAVDKQTAERCLVDLVRTKTGVSEQRRIVRETHAKWGAVKVLVENASLQAYFYEDQFQGLPVQPMTTGSNKMSVDEGIPTLVALVKAGMLRIPWGDADAQVRSHPFVKELEDFPYGETSDCIMGWWFCEREIRKLFYEAGSVSENRNFFQRKRIARIRSAGGFLRQPRH